MPTVIPLFNTGVDAYGAALASGTDTHFVVSAADDSSYVGDAKVVPSTEWVFGGPWVGNDATSAWITPDAAGTDGGAPAGTYTFLTTFDLTGSTPADAVLTGRWAVDNTTEIYLNGVATGVAASGYGSWSSFALLDGAGGSAFVSGVNTLAFVVYNDGGPVGLRLGNALLTDAPQVTVEKVADVTEGGSDSEIQFTRMGDLTASLTVSYTIGGTAGSSDHALGTTGSIMFAANVGTASLIFAPTDDSTAEPTETMVFTLTSSTEYTIGTPGTATLNILDDDMPVVFVLSLSDAVEGGAAGALRFIRQGDLSQPLTVTYTVGGTATPGADYAALSGTVTFPATPGVGPAVDFVDVPVAVLTGDPARVGATVSVTLQAGAGYAIPDDSATAPTGSGIPVGFADAVVMILDNTQLAFTLPTALGQPELTGAISYTFPWNQVDPALGSQTIALPDFDLSIAGRDFRYASGADPTYAFAGVPTATFQDGVFVGVTFSITSTAGAPPLAGVYTSLSSGAAAGLTVTAADALGNAASAGVLPVGPAYSIDFRLSPEGPQPPAQPAVTIEGAKAELSKDPTAKALLKAFEDAGGKVQAGDAATGAKIIGFKLIILDPKNLKGTNQAVNGLLFELVRWELREDDIKLKDSLAKNLPSAKTKEAFDAVLKDYVTALEKVTYKVVKRHHQIAEAATKADKPENRWDPKVDEYKSDAQKTEEEFLKWAQDPKSGGGTNSHTQRLMNQYIEIFKEFRNKLPDK